MTKCPELKKKLTNAGWVILRRGKGSHTILTHPDRPGERIVFADHCSYATTPSTLLSRATTAHPGVRYFYPAEVQTRQIPAPLGHAVCCWLHKTNPYRLTGIILFSINETMAASIVSSNFLAHKHPLSAMLPKSADNSVFGYWGPLFQSI